MNVLNLIFGGINGVDIEFTAKFSTSFLVLNVHKFYYHPLKKKFPRLIGDSSILYTYLTRFVGHLKIFSNQHNSLQSIEEANPINWQIFGLDPSKAILSYTEKM